MIPAVTLGPSHSASAAISSFKSQLIGLLNIPVHLTGSGDVTLPVAYQKYKAYLVACSTLDDMVADGTWTIGRPTRTDLVELFVSKSFFHSHYRRHFSKVADYSEMVAWLEGQPGSVDVDVWGVKKANYSFSDLKTWLANGGVLELDNEDEELEKHEVLKKGEGKGKEKALEKRKGKGKNLEERKEKEKEKKKEKEKGYKRKESSKRAK